jgi:two-component system sensor histidine kinase/response regulator
MVLLAGRPAFKIFCVFSLLCALLACTAYAGRAYAHALASKTAVLFVNFSANPDGTVYSPPQVVRRISGAANAPVFGLFDTLLVKGGIVGGVMPTLANEAARTVRHALEILSGRLPTAPVTVSPARFIPMFDWDQLNRWGMDENKLPSGSMILNRSRTLWTEYRGLSSGARPPSWY